MKCKCGIEWKNDDGSFYVVDAFVTGWSCKYCPDCGDELAKIREDYEPGLYIIEKTPLRRAALFTEGGDWYVIRESEKTSQLLVERVTEEMADGKYQVIRKINVEK